jgi:hypothetical protein
MIYTSTEYAFFDYSSGTHLGGECISIHIYMPTTYATASGDGPAAERA